MFFKTVVRQSAFRYRRVSAATTQCSSVFHATDRWMSSAGGGSRGVEDNQTSSDAWIPPNRPLIGDQMPYYDKTSLGKSDASNDDEEEEEELRRLQLEIDRLDAEETFKPSSPTTSTLSSSIQNIDEAEELRIIQDEIAKLEEEESRSQKKKRVVVDEDTSVDWLRTRRQVLGQKETAFTATIPGAAGHEDLFEVEVKHHTLLKRGEIVTIMDALGGQDIKVIYDNPKERRMGGAMGMILVTATRSSHMRIMADTLVRHMRRRKLQEVDVLGAKHGPEGQEDSNWMVVDCRSFIVHIFDEKIRQGLNFDAIWSGEDPLHRLDHSDEEAVEDYVAAYPVPDIYTAPSFDWDERFRELQKNRWTAPHKQVVKRPRMKRRKR